MGCPRASTCDLFAQVQTGKVWQAIYCDPEARHSECARYVLLMAGKVVPAALLPNGVDVGLRELR